MAELRCRACLLESESQRRLGDREGFGMPLS